MQGARIAHADLGFGGFCGIDTKPSAPSPPARRYFRR
jgi:hypothetical protein